MKFKIHIIYFMVMSALPFMFQCTHEKSNAAKIKDIDSLLDEYKHEMSDSVHLELHNLLDKSKQISYTEGEVRANLYIADRALFDKDFYSVVKHCNAAHQLCKTCSDYEFTANTYLKIGKVYEKFNNYEIAEEYFAEMLKVARENADKEIQMEAINEIGCLHYKKGDYAKGVPYLEQTLEIAKELNDKNMIAGALSNLGMIHVSKKEYHLALEKMEAALAINIEIRNKRWEAVNYHNMGIIYQNLELFDDAEKYFNMALEIDENIGSKYEIISDLISLGGFYFSIENYGKAEQYLQESFEQASQTGFLNLQKRTTELLGKVYIAIEKYKEATQILTTNLALRDSSSNESESRKFYEMKIQHTYNNFRSEQQIQKQRTTFVIIIIVFSLFFVISVLVLLYNRQRIKTSNAKLEQQKIQQQLEIERTKFINVKLEKQNLKNSLDKERMEIISKELHLSEKKALLQSLSEKLKLLKEDLDEEGQKGLQKIIAGIKLDMKSNIWDEFEIRFQELHTDFYEKLNSNYPSLTLNDKKLCAFLRLNLSTKDIASITYQSPKTINVARTRLRKKLNLTNTDVDLNRFLSSL